MGRDAPLSIELTAGERDESTQLEALLEDIPLLRKSPSTL